MELALLDWIIIIGFFLLIVGVGLSYTRKAGKDLDSFFLGGRNLPWYIAGISMVATTFAADTPLAVTELVGQSGIAGNWLWWSFLAGGMLTTFFFAKLWRKSGVLTEVELIELRYGGPQAAFLRGFKSIYLGVFMNMVIIAWVNVALMALLEVFFGLTGDQALLYTAGAMLLVAVYSSLSGLLGVAMTDVIQFTIAMIGCIILAVLVLTSEQIGGVSGLKASLPAGTLDFFPSISGDGATVGKTLGLSFGAFFAYAGVQWWASWYPGSEPGGGGYVAQRMMSAKSEKDAVFATLFFQIAHYCIRPWPWIIVGLCAVVLYPELPAEDVKLGYVYAMRDFLPAGLKGLLLIAFFAAYMSTISTQLNWGASYMVNDFYKRFIASDKDDKHYVLVSRIATIFLMGCGLAATSQVNSISGAWGFLMQCGAGLGMVLILRWYWWRINAWSEISATLGPFVAMAALKTQELILLGPLNEAHPEGIPTNISEAFYAEHAYLSFPNSFLITVAFTTVVWLLVTFLTKPTNREKLQFFYNKVQPDGAWGDFTLQVMKPKPDYSQGSGKVLDQPETKANNLLNLVICWLSSIVMTYGILFLIGKLILAEWAEAGILALVVAVSFVVLRQFVTKTRILAD